VRVDRLRFAIWELIQPPGTGNCPAGRLLDSRRRRAGVDERDRLESG
jgi:hypothetical protein